MFLVAIPPMHYVHITQRFSRASIMVTLGCIHIAYSYSPHVVSSCHAANALGIVFNRHFKRHKRPCTGILFLLAILPLHYVHIT